LLHWNRRRLLGGQVHAVVGPHRLHGAGRAHERFLSWVPLGLSTSGFWGSHLLLLGQLLLM
jgi:hypothetical protein